MNREQITKEFASSITETLVNLIGAQAARAVFEKEFSAEEVSIGENGKVKFGAGSIIEEGTKKLLLFLLIGL